MANRALLAKAARAVEQRRELGAHEFGKACYLIGPDKAALSAIAADYKGVVHRCKPGAAKYARGQWAKGSQVCSGKLWIR